LRHLTPSEGGKQSARRRLRRNRVAAIAAVCLSLALGAGVSAKGSAPAPSSSAGTAIGALAGAGGAAAAPKVAKSGAGTTALSVACANSAPILDRYAAIAFPKAAPYIPDAERAFASFCQGALPTARRPRKARPSSTPPSRSFSASG